MAIIYRFAFYGESPQLPNNRKHGKIYSETLATFPPAYFTFSGCLSLHRFRRKYGFIIFSVNIYHHVAFFI